MNAATQGQRCCWRRLPPEEQSGNCVNTSEQLFLRRNSSAPEEPAEARQWSVSPRSLGQLYRCPTSPGAICTIRITACRLLSQLGAQRTLMVLAAPRCGPSQVFWRLHTVSTWGSPLRGSFARPCLLGMFQNTEESTPAGAASGQADENQG